MITAVSRVGFTVSDMETALRFYTETLPFTRVGDAEVMGAPYEQLMGVFGARIRVVTLALGAERVHLSEYIAPPGGRPIPTDSRSNDLWFQHIAIVVSDMDAAYARLRQHRVRHVSSAPQTLPDTLPAAAGIKAFYFLDPDGHVLELIAFPPGKGDPRWQAGAALFLGIDHTAIAVADTDASRIVYERGFGMTVTGESLNYGTEQEHLNGVFGCRVRITGWRASEGGMGVEFLDYRAPAGGRPMPVDTRAIDGWHWETLLVSDDLEREFASVDPAVGGTISPQIVALPDDNPYGARRAFMRRDLDGHALMVMERR